MPSTRRPTSSVTAIPRGLRSSVAILWTVYAYWRLAYHQLRFRSPCRIALAATVVMANGPMSLVNVHLDTRINSKDRLGATGSGARRARRRGQSQLIGGDFNTMDVRWVRTMWPLLYVDRQTAAVRKRLAADGFHHSVRRYARNHQAFSTSSDPTGLALFEAVDGARLRRRHGPADRPSRRVDWHGFRLTRRDTDGSRGQAPQSSRPLKDRFGQRHAI